MKINKIICDACKEEIDVEKDSGLAVFEYIEAKIKSNFTPGPAAHSVPMAMEREIIKTSFDLCKMCADSVVELIEKKKKETEEKNKKDKKE